MRSLPLLCALTVLVSGCTAADIALLANALDEPTSSPSPTTNTTLKGSPQPVIPVQTPVTQPSGSEDEQALAAVNAVRVRAGLDPVVVDEELSRGCRLHAEYLRLNRGSPEIAGLLAHQEVDTLPGATVDGANAGINSDIAYVPLVVAVDHWMDSLYHRTPILSPSLQTIGLGSTKDDHGSVSLLRFRDVRIAPSSAFPIRYPVDGQRDVTLTMGNEIPNPVPAGEPGKAGYPITLMFEPYKPLVTGEVTLTDDAGAVVPFYLSTPDKPAGDKFEQFSIVCLIPKHALLPASTYQVSITASSDGAPENTWAWSFTTVASK